MDSLFSGRCEMFEDHPSPEDLDEFLRGASRSVRHARNAQVMRHLLSRCAVCRDRLSVMGWSDGRLSRRLRLVTDNSQSGGNFSSPTTAGESETYDYGRAFALAERSVTAFLAPENHPTGKPADLLLAELADLPPSEQIERVGSGGIYATPLVIRGLIDRSHSVRYKDANQMLHFARLAKLAAEDGSAVGDELKLADLRARAWGQYGTALRVCGRPHEAEEALLVAQEYRRKGTGDPALRAWLLERLTALANFQERFSDAIEMCEEGGRIYQELGENHLFAITLVQKAIALIYSGEAETAVRTLNHAIPLIDCEEDPHLLLAACHNLIRCYIDLDRPDQALMLCSEVREIYQEFDDPLFLLKATWQEGKLLCDLGHLRAAETALLRVRKGFMERGIPQEVAFVSLDLATVYVKLGLVDEVKRTVMTTLPIFHALRVKVETLAALLQLQRVADQEQQALELIRTLNSRIEALPKKSAG
jgi:tetratricopeptide (TPR) repeat protein